jgi:palmitoyltransferase
MDALLDGLNNCFERFVYIIGPMLIILALAIVSLLVHAFVTILVPMMRLKYASSSYGSLIVGLHILWVGFLVVNVLYNYAFCVLTRNTGPHYDQVIREIATVTNFVYPETPAQVALYKDEYEHRMIMRIRRRREKEAAEVTAAAAQSEHAPSGESRAQLRHASQLVNPPPPAPIRQWMLLGPYEWGYCSLTNQPKPPRSHYDHVTKSLILNLDHYCPWMFNAGKCVSHTG